MTTPDMGGSGPGDEVLAVRLGKQGALFVFCDEHCAEDWIASHCGLLLERVPYDTNACLHCAACGFLISWPRAGCSLHDDGCPEIWFEATSAAVDIARALLPTGVSEAYVPWPLLAVAADLWYHDYTYAPGELARRAARQWRRQQERPRPTED